MTYEYFRADYFVLVGDQIGQTALRQLDGLADIGAELSRALGRPVSDLWRMQNGYALASKSGLEMISATFARSANRGLMHWAVGCA